MTVNTTIGKITASKEVLNELSLSFSYSARYYEKVGYDGRCREARRVSEEIYEALNKTGYYVH